MNSKKDVSLALLEKGSVYLHINPDTPGVMVPESTKSLEHLVLQIGLNMPVPIQDLEVDDQGFRGALSFGRSPFHCQVPWKAVYLIAAEDHSFGMMYKEDMPPNIRARMEGQPPKPKAPFLRVVPNKELN